MALHEAAVLVARVLASDRGCGLPPGSAVGDGRVDRRVPGRVHHDPSDGDERVARVGVHGDPRTWAWLAVALELRRVVRPDGLVVIIEQNPLNPLTRLAVSRCEFDKGVVLLTNRSLTRLLTDAGLEAVERRYIIFFASDRPRLKAVERSLGRVPFGAQHYLAARRKEPA